MTPFSIAAPGRILFGRGEAARVPELIAALGARVFVVHGASAARAEGVLRGLWALGVTVETFACAAEPDLAVLDAAVAAARAAGAEVVVGIGGGAAIDLAKAVAALVPAPGGAMDHLEVVGRGLPLVADPLPFVAIPTTAGTGAEATRNAVIGLPAYRRKVSLRDDRMFARLAIVDPALTDGCPRGVTLASGLDAVTQLIEAFLSSRATPYTEALTRAAIPQALGALIRLIEEGEDAEARDRMAWASLCSGIALSNGGLGAVHGLAGPIGGMTGAAHGAICGVLLAPVLQVNAAKATGRAADRIAEARGMISRALRCAPGGAFLSLARWIADAGLPPLSLQGLAPEARPIAADAALRSSSMAGNPVALSLTDLVTAMAAAG